MCRGAAPNEPGSDRTRTGQQGWDWPDTPPNGSMVQQVPSGCPEGGSWGWAGIGDQIEGEAERGLQEPGDQLTVAGKDTEQVRPGPQAWGNKKDRGAGAKLGGTQVAEEEGLELVPLREVLRAPS